MIPHVKKYVCRKQSHMNIVFWYWVHFILNVIEVKIIWESHNTCNLYIFLWIVYLTAWFFCRVAYAHSPMRYQQVKTWLDSLFYLPCYKDNVHRNLTALSLQPLVTQINFLAKAWAGLLLIWHSGTNFRDISIKKQYDDLHTGKLM